MYKILVVEDEDIIRKGLVYMVDWTKLNCIVAGEARDGIEGLKKIRELKPDIVITDIRMPFMDGIQMLEKSRSELDYETIIISGYSEFEYAKKAITFGVTDYLLKPIDFEELNDAINKITRKLGDKKKAKAKIQSQNEINLYEKVLNIKHYNSVGNKSKHVEQMIDYIENNYNNKISLNDLCDEMELSSVYLNNLFKHETNYTFNDFLNRYRILISIQLLKDGKLMIYEIAENVGFQDYKYFSIVFKKYIGASPTVFLESLS